MHTLVKRKLQHKMLDKFDLWEAILVVCIFWRGRNLHCPILPVIDDIRQTKEIFLKSRLIITLDKIQIEVFREAFQHSNLSLRMYVLLLFDSTCDGPATGLI